MSLFDDEDVPDFAPPNEPQLIELYGGPCDGERKAVKYLPDVIEAVLRQTPEGAAHQPPVQVKAIYRRSRYKTGDGLIKYTYQGESLIATR